VADRVVNVQLNLGTAGYRRGAQQAEQDNRRVAASAQIAAANAQEAFNRSSAAQIAAANAAQRAQQAAFARTAQEATATARTVTESATRSTAATGRFGTQLAEIPPAFRASGVAGVGAFGEISTAAVRTSVAIGQTTTAITTATTSAATGASRLSLANRLAIAETMTATQAAAAAAAAAGAASAEAAAVSATAWSRAQASVVAFGATTRAQAAAASSAMVASATSSAAAWKATRVAGIALLAVFAAAVVAASRFEQAMSIVAAASGATGEELDQLRTSALEAGKATVFSAREAAEAEAELARAGVSVADITGGALRASLDLASAGQLGLAESAVLTAQAMNAFGLKGKDTARIADVIAAAAGKSATNVHDMGFAFRMSALVAQQTGLSLEDTAGTLALFAQNALVGSDAGTSLKTMLQRLTPQSDEARGVMQRLGFSAYDSAGQFVGLNELAKRLSVSFGNLTPEARNAAFGVIFGSDAVRAATILYRNGEAGVRQWTAAVTDQGFASRVAQQQTDNLIGDLERLRGSLETALIEGGSKATVGLREIAQWITHLIDAYNNLSPELQANITLTMGLVGALALAAGAFVLILPRVVAFRAAVTELAVTMPRLAAAASATTGFMFGPWGIALAAGITALTMFAGAADDAKDDVKDLTSAVQADSGAVGENTKKWLAHKLEADGVLKAASKVGVSTADLTEAILGSGEALDRVRAQMAPYKDQLSDLGDVQFDVQKGTHTWTGGVKAVEDALGSLTPKVAGATDAAKREAEAAGGAATGTAKLGTEAQKTTADLEKQKSAAEKLSDALDVLNGRNIGAAKAAITFQGSLADLTDKVKESGTGLDIATAKGREVKDAYLGAAAAALAHAEAVSKQQDSVEAGQAVLARDIEMLKATMRQAGFTELQIESLTRAYTQLPPTAQTTVTDPGALQVIADLERVRQKVEGVPPGKSISMRAVTAEAEQDLVALGYKVEHMKDGTVKVTVPVSDAFNSTTAIQSYIDQIKGRSVSIRVNTDFYTSGVGPYGGKPLPMPQAAGSVITMASGGVTAAASGLTTRQAMVANRPILWAEAGPEAYIPLSASRRARSTALLSEVADQFGYQLAPAARDLTPVRSIAGSPVPASAPLGGDRVTNITLNGARQDSAEQAADIARHLAFTT
jgi:TP901 family phage tail tape measure protein